MSVSRPRPRVPTVNLLDPPAKGLRLPIPTRVLEVALVLVVIAAWGAAAAGIALLLGWRPPLGLGP